MALKILGEKVENFQAGVISLKSPLKDNIPLKNKSSSIDTVKSSSDPYLLDEFGDFLKSIILEIFDKEKSFVSL